MFLLYKIPKQNLYFLVFVFFVLFSMVRVHAKAGPWGRPHAEYPMGSFERTFFTLRRKTLLSENTYDTCTRARPKTFQKKKQKLLERGPGGEPLPAAWARKTIGF